METGALVCSCDTCGAVHLAAKVVSGLERRGRLYTTMTDLLLDLRSGETVSGKTCYACGLSQLWLVLGTLSQTEQYFQSDPQQLRLPLGEKV